MERNDRGSPHECRSILSRMESQWGRCNRRRNRNVGRFAEFPLLLADVARSRKKLTGCSFCFSRQRSFTPVCSASFPRCEENNLLVRGDDFTIFYLYKRIVSVDFQNWHEVTNYRYYLFNFGLGMDFACNSFHSSFHIAAALLSAAQKINKIIYSCLF